MRLYSDLLDGSARRYYFELDSAPGGITNAAPALLTLNGRSIAIQELSEAFRTPATATLTLVNGLVVAEPHLIPAPAALAYQGQIPGLLTLQVITNALPPDYTDLPDNAPTILFIATITPAPAALSMASLVHNITQGGNILEISVGIATLTLSGYVPNLPRFAEVGSVTVNGRTATLLTELAISPGTGSLAVGGLEAILSLPFIWIDDDPVTPTTWIDD